MVVVSVSLRTLVTVGSSARGGGGAQSAAEVVVPGVVITQSVGVPGDVDHHGSVQEVTVSWSFSDSNCS